MPVSVITMKDPIIISPSMKCQTAMEIMNDRNVDQLPVVDNDGSISGMKKSRDETSYHLILCDITWYDVMSRGMTSYLVV